MRHAALATLLIVSALAGCTSVPESGADGCRPGSTDWLFRVAHFPSWLAKGDLPVLEIVTVDGDLIRLVGSWSLVGQGTVLVTPDATLRDMNVSEIKEALILAGWYHPDRNYNISHATRTELADDTFLRLCDQISNQFHGLPSTYQGLPITHDAPILYEASTADGTHQVTVRGLGRPETLQTMVDLLPELDDVAERPNRSPFIRN